MVSQISYDINTTEGPLHITITPVNQLLPNGDYYATGVYKLSDGVVGMGAITFEEDMTEWDYDGIGELTFEEAAEIASFIKNYKDPAGADPNLLL
jgi:hypothetical protein